MIIQLNLDLDMKISYIFEYISKQIRMKIAVHYIGDLDKLDQVHYHHYAAFELYKHEVDYYIHTWDTPENHTQITKFSKSKVSSLIPPTFNSGNIHPYALLADKFYLLMVSLSNHTADAKYDAVLVLQPSLVLERKLQIDKYDLGVLNTLTPSFHEDTSITDIYFNNMCMFSNVQNMIKYSQIYRYLVGNLLNQNMTVEEIYQDFMNVMSLKQYKISMESYIHRNPVEIVGAGGVTSKICLIIAFYFGSRTKNETFHNLIDIQSRMLKKYKHSLAKIVFAIAQDDRNSVSIEEKDGITYFYKPNLGLSFGSWHTVINHYKDTYSHYILGEDDYVFVKDNFDRILLDQYNQKGAEYLVTWKSLRGRLISTIGIVSSKVLNKHNYLNNIDWTTDKDTSMWTFLRTFTSVKPLAKEYSAFPYWGIIDRWDVWLFDYICGESELDYLNRTLVAAVQFIDEHDNLKVPQISNVLVVEENLDLVKYY